MLDVIIEIGNIVFTVEIAATDTNAKVIGSNSFLSRTTAKEEDTNIKIKHTYIVSCKEELAFQNQD